MRNKRSNKLGMGIVFATNILLVILLAVSMGDYFWQYNADINEQNLNDIKNIALSSANNAKTVIQNQQSKLTDFVHYCEQSGFGYKQAFDYINLANTDKDVVFQLVKSDYSGYSSVKNSADEYSAVLYDSIAYKSLWKAFENVTSGVDDVNFTAEFTDSVSALKCVALYSPITLKENGNQVLYTALEVSQKDDMYNRIAAVGSYKDLTTALVDGSGSYILSDSDFKADGIYNYLYEYNDLSLDQKNDIIAEVTGNTVGTIQMKDYVGNDTVYAYARVPDSTLYAFVSVPVSSFIVRSTSLTLTMRIACILIVLMTVDLLWMYIMNRRTRRSMANEKLANSAKTDFLARMSHDMRTPMNAVLGFSNDIANANADEKTLRENISKIHQSGNYLLSLINDVLDMSRIESKKTELKSDHICGKELFDSINNMLESLAKTKGVEYSASSDSIDLYQYFLIDKSKVQQICVNLLSNAMRYTPQGGNVMFELSMLNETEHDAQLRMVVRDNGIGMSEQFQKKMFEPFEQENPNHGGTGLGLAICRSLVDRMSGSIDCVSSVGVGTEFTVIIPVKYCEAPEKQELDESLQKEHGGSIEGQRVLLAEDQPMNVQIAQILLESRGVTSEVAENGQIAVDMFTASEKGYYSAILMDISMPVMDGLEATRIIRALPRTDAATIPIIAMTANAYEEDYKKSIEAGMNDHLSKPIEPELMFKALCRYIGK